MPVDRLGWRGSHSLSIVVMGVPLAAAVRSGLGGTNASYWAAPMEDAHEPP